MTKRTWLRLGLAGLAALGAFMGYLWLTMPSHRINRESFEQITEGMTQAEVEAILRAPPGKHCSGSAMLEMKRADGSSCGIAVDEVWGKMEEFQAELKELNCDIRRTWVGDRGVIVVSFDDNDRVVAKDFVEMYSAGIVARIRNWLAAIF